jgi:DNA-binding MarR family transcriptional regulator
MATKLAALAAHSEPSLGYAFSDLLRLLRRDFHSRASGLGLTPALARLLFHVHRAPGSRQTDLAARLEVTPVTLGRMIDRLVNRGYVTRDQDAADRRAVRVYVAPRGEPLVARMAQIAEGTKARALEGIGPRQRRTLYSLLAQVAENLGGEAQSWTR